MALASPQPPTKKFPSKITHYTAYTEYTLSSVMFLFILIDGTEKHCTVHYPPVLPGKGLHLTALNNAHKFHNRRNKDRPSDTWKVKDWLPWRNTLFLVRKLRYICMVTIMSWFKVHCLYYFTSFSNKEKVKYYCIYVCILNPSLLLEKPGVKFCFKPFSVLILALIPALHTCPIIISWKHHRTYIHIHT